MGRELRMVPPGWEHPKDTDGRHIPLLDSMPRAAMQRQVASWYEQRDLWEHGKHPDQRSDLAAQTRTFTEWHGAPPNPDEHMPCWEPQERTHFQMYETCSEGTPISPVCESAEELARWLVDNNASAFAGETASYDAWLATIKRGWAPSALLIGGKMQSGVEALKKEG